MQHPPVPHWIPVTEASKGIRNQDYLNLRVVFEPYVMGVTLIACDCGRMEVLNEATGIQRAIMDIRDPTTRQCLDCATIDA